MSISSLLSFWRADPGVAGNIDTWHSLPGRPAQFRPLPPDLHPALRQTLQLSGIQALFSHQAAAWEHLQSGRNVAIVTATASGKTLAYNLPVLDRLLRDPQARALYLFPTKALAQDQLSVFNNYLSILSENGVPTPIPVSTYDGDTPTGSRPAIRGRARVVISNPDMLHTGILPHHTGWAEFFRRLAFVVIDEMHGYRGVFGSHLANVVRRLKRICAFYGSKPQFVLTSATIANPLELAGRLVEEQVSLIDEDGAAHGPKSFLIYNPPIVDPDLGLRRSALHESVRLAEDLLAYNVQTIVFARSRRSVELILTYLRQKASALSPTPLFPSSPVAGEEGNRGVGDEIRGYRSGYLPRQRREIERGLRQGQVRAVVATNALELGIDIGDLGAALLVGYPGSIAAAWQQAGRAGRGEAASLAVLIATADPLDQFLAAHPDYLFGRSPEQALINPDNLLILLDHLRCAAFELPFRAGESFGRLDPGQVQEFLDFLLEEGVLYRSADRYFWMADQYPAQNVSLRSASAQNVVLQSWDDEDWPEAGDWARNSASRISGPTLANSRSRQPVTIGQVDRASACWMVHPQAVYLHEGQMYVVDELDLEQNTARLRRAEVDYYTEPSSETTVQLLEKLDEGPARGATRAYGEIRVTTQVTGYRQVRWFTHEQLGLGQVDLPPSELQTTGYWLALGEETVDRLREEGLWRNDPIDYGPNWPAQRDRARARDGYRCQMCGAPEKGRSHDVHHKVPFRTVLAGYGSLAAERRGEAPAQAPFRRDAPRAGNLQRRSPAYELANRLENLVTLCPNCHRRAETAVRVRSGLAGLAYVLGHLAPFFLMCDSRDLGVHSDPQAPLAEARPAVVLYDQVPAGIGFSQRLFELHDELVGRAFELVRACECADGCPSCVGPGGENGLGGKRETLAILEALKT